jgi:hypothetical protein
LAHILVGEPVATSPGYALEAHRPDCYKPAMPVRIRKLIGTIALLALVIVWALVAMAIAQPVLASASGLVAGIYYVVAGLGWVLPAMPLIKWMSRPDASDS